MGASLARLTAPLRPSRNPALRRELRRLRRGVARSPWAFAFFLAVAAHAGYALWLNFQNVGDTASLDLPVGKETVYDFQFTLFHLLLYLVPCGLAFPSLQRRLRSGAFEAESLTRLSRADLLWAFVLPWATFTLAPIALFYLPMLPWRDWWLVRFLPESGGGHGDLHQMFYEDSWTSFHMLITWVYLLTIALWNAVAVVWVSLRARTPTAGLVRLVLISLAVDFVACSLCATVYGEEPDVMGVWEWLIGFAPEYPVFLAYMLMFHSWAPFAAIFYPLKWLTMGLMVRDVARRLPASSWTRV